MSVWASSVLTLASRRCMVLSAARRMLARRWRTAAEAAAVSKPEKELCSGGDNKDGLIWSSAALKGTVPLQNPAGPTEQDTRLTYEEIQRNQTQKNKTGKYRKPERTDQVQVQVWV